MNELNQSEIETICKKLVDDFRGILSWEWDGRSRTILTKFSADQEKDVRTILEKFLPISWDSSSIGTAPQIVQTIDNQLGGLRPTHFLFSSDPSHDTFVFCAWWPWENGATISLRIAPFDKNLSEQEEHISIEKLKVWADI